MAIEYLTFEGLKEETEAARKVFEEMEQSEIPKHRKKTQSSTSKSRNKTNHKHEYKECLFVKKGRPHRGSYCTICGKIGDMSFLETVKTDIGTYRVMDSDEVFEKYKHLEQVEIEDTFQKYVPVSN